MRNRQHKTRTTHGFTLVELMIVVVIVAVLMLVAVPMYQANRKAGMMTEGITGAGMIRTSMRTYSASHNNQYPTLSSVDGSGLAVLLVRGQDLVGKYFTPSAYSVTSTSTAYTIRATLPEDTTFWYEIDEGGNVSKSNF